MGSLVIVPPVVDPPAEDPDVVFESSVTYSPECSLAGGCLLTINQPGVTASHLTGDFMVNICGRECTALYDDSDQNSFTCEAPAIETRLSLGEFKINPRSNVIGETQSSNPDSLAATVFDGQNLPGTSESTDNCFMQVTYPDGYVGYIERVRIFMDTFTDNSPYVENLKFQGSDDDFTTVTEIFTVGVEIHEGWNVYDMSDYGSPEAMASYRLINEVN
jgi:hypothetical protein